MKKLIAVHFEAKSDGTILGTSTALDCEETPKTLRKITGDRRYIGNRSMVLKDELDVVHTPNYTTLHSYWAWGAMYVDVDDESFADTLKELTDKVMDVFSKEISDRHKLYNSWANAMTGKVDKEQ